MTGRRCPRRHSWPRRARRSPRPRGAGRRPARGATLDPPTSPAEPPNRIVEDGQAPAESDERDTLVDPVPALQVRLLGWLAEGREAEDGHAELEQVLGVGAERGHDRQRRAARIVGADDVREHREEALWVAVV